MDSALVILGEWSSYRGDRLNRFSCNWLVSTLKYRFTLLGLFTLDTHLPGLFIGHGVFIVLINWRRGGTILVKLVLETLF